MEDIKDKDAARLVCLIYGATIETDWENANSNKLSDIVTIMENSVSNISPDKKIGGEMTKEEFLILIDQVKDSDTLMRMEIKDFTNNDETDFRAMTLVDPENKVKPTIVYRGTAGDGQWDDNFSAIFSSVTPSQKEAAAYVANSGLDHVTIAGHSKGGNMAASCAYLLPEGMVDKVYSYDGQGESQAFLRNISASKQNYAKSIVYNINEYRDPVSQILVKTGLDENSTYFDSGVDYFEGDFTEEGFNAKMYAFHVHKPNYYLKPGVKKINRTFVPSRLAHTITMMNEIDALQEGTKRKVAQEISKLLYVKENGQTLPNSTKWSDQYYDCVLKAEEVYSNVNKSREETICKKMSEMYGVDFSKYKLEQKDSSFVVEGAILTCPYCGGIGELKGIENHGNLIHRKAVASKKDNKPQNIVMENCECTADTPDLLMENSESEGTQSCVPEIYHEWVITEPDKALYINGERVEAVLKISVLGCCRGGIITVEDNGQMDMGAVKKLSLQERAKKAIQNNKILQSKPVQYTINKEKRAFKDTFRDDKSQDMLDKMYLSIDLAETTINVADEVIENTIDNIKYSTNQVINQLAEEEEKFIQKYINQQLQYK